MVHVDPRLSGSGVLVATIISMTNAETLDRIQPVLDDGGDHDRFAHYVKSNMIMSSAVEGTPLEALCGKIWVPSRDPKKYPVCPECKEIYEGLSND